MIPAIAEEYGDRLPDQRNILLISVQDNFSTIGLRYLHYLLMEHGFNSHLLFLRYFKQGDRRQLERLRAFVLEMAPAWIGVSLMTDEYLAACEVTDYLKGQLPQIPIIWGGMHATASPETCFPHADYACIGEGEHAILEVAHCIGSGGDLGEIKNLCYMKGGALHRNELSARVEDLDQVPYYDHVPRQAHLQLATGQVEPLDKERFCRHERYWGRSYDVMTSRGCPFACTYCCNSLIMKLYGKGKIRRRSVEHIISELENALRQSPEIELIHVHDDSFASCNRAYLDEFCEAYRTRVNRPFYAHAVPTAVTHEKVSKLKAAGMRWLSIGLQSGSAHVCKEIYRRGAAPDDVLRAARIINDVGVAPVYDVIVDNPLETDAQRVETINVLMKTPRPYYLQIYALQAYFGTQLYEELKDTCPDSIVDPRRKNYLDYQDTPLNVMTRLAVYLDRRHMKLLLELHSRDETSALFRGALFFSRWISALTHEPLTYFRVLNMAADGSLKETLKLLYFYSSNITRYLRQFNKS